MNIEVKAPRRANGRVSDDAYFLGLCILYAGFENKERSRAVLREIQRIGKFEMLGEPNE